MLNHKKHFSIKNKRYRTIKKGNKTQKHCYNDDDIMNVCSSGRFTKIHGQGLYTKKSLDKFKELEKQLRRSKKYKNIKVPVLKYKKLLIDTFHKHSNNKEETALIKKNFYGYVNDTWIKEKEQEIAKNPHYYVQYDTFRVTQDKVYYQLIDYVKNYIKANPNSEKAIAIKNVYDSLRKDTKKTVHMHAHNISQIVTNFFVKGDMYALLAYVNSNEIVSWGAPIVWTTQPDEKNVVKYVSHLAPVQLSLYDYMLYVDDASDDKEAVAYKKYVKSHYLTYIGETFKACLGAEVAKQYDPNDIWEVELELLDAMGCTKIKKQDPDFYNVVTAQELEKTYQFDWPVFAKKLGFVNPPQKVIVSDLNSLKCITELLKKNWNTPQWKTYWLFLYFRQMIRFEISYRHIHYNFYKKILEGQPVIMPEEIYPIYALSMTFNTFLTEEYVKHNYNQLYVNYVQHLAEDLKTLFIRKLRRNTWLEPSTRATAIKKMEKLKFTVGQPAKLRYDPIYKYKGDDPWFNMELLTKWKHNKFLTLEGKPVIDIPEIDWTNFKLVGTQAYMVNAYYMPTSNSIYIPLAYIQPPFIDLAERGLEYNLTYIGYTIGHELSHALDDEGSKFDENGNLHNWWTPRDRKIFQSKIDNVVKQYEEFAARDGIKFDASFGVGEDLADISGLSLVQEYLLDNQILENDIDIIKRDKLKMFYIYIAIQGQQTVYKNALKAQLKINPHPLEKYRTNCPLSRLNIFREVFGIKKGDGMWWSNTDTIW